jgi:hypothetical protein
MGACHPTIGTRGSEKSDVKNESWWVVGVVTRAGTLAFSAPRQFTSREAAEGGVGRVFGKNSESAFGKWRGAIVVQGPFASSEDAISASLEIESLLGACGGE